MATKEEIVGLFPRMMEKFQADKAAGLNATIQFDLSGENGGLFWIRINEGQVEHGNGEASSPNMTMKASADDFYGLVTGATNPVQAFMMGKVKVTDVGLGMKMMNIFQMG